MVGWHQAVIYQHFQSDLVTNWQLAQLSEQRCFCADSVSFASAVGLQHSVLSAASRSRTREAPHGLHCSNPILKSLKPALLRSSYRSPRTATATVPAEADKIMHSKLHPRSACMYSEMTIYCHNHRAIPISPIEFRETCSFYMKRKFLVPKDA